jgi:YlmC/YmxH family sporulation protein
VKGQRITDLSYKEVIHLQTGQRLGYVRDAEIDPETGKVVALIIPGRLRWLGLLGREPETVIPWDGIRRLGEDIIFVGENRPLDRTEPV